MARNSSTAAAAWAQPPSPAPVPGRVFAWFKDPGGNVLGIYQQPGLAEMERTAAGQSARS